MAHSRIPYERIHLVGIGGVGMSAIATVLLGRGHRISGSDLAENVFTRRLRAAGADVAVGHAAGHVDGAELVIVSTAIRAENPEWREARRRGLPIWRRGRALAQILKAGRALAITGTHGKTTTTAMAGLALIDAGLDPTVLVGADVPGLGGNARVGAGPWLVAEVDESDGSLVESRPELAILTNVEPDHLDYYRDLAHLTETFEAFLGRLPPAGVAIGCLDNPPVQCLFSRWGGPRRTYGLDHPGADLTARGIVHPSGLGGVAFEAVHHRRSLGEVRLRIPGRHNVANALAVILAGLEIGLDFETVAASLSRYGGADRRYQIKGACGGVTVIDDYAHHPTEIKATLAAARARLAEPPAGRIVGVFQPHRYTRTASLGPEFGPAFREADTLVVTDVYAAGEDPIAGVDGQVIADVVARDGHPDVHYVAQPADVVEFLKPRLRAGDLLFTLGAGDIWRVGEDLLRALAEREGTLRAAG